jgi:diguanylate cyclase (GGDEF)-like protein
MASPKKKRRIEAALGYGESAGPVDGLGEVLAPPVAPQAIERAWPLLDALPFPVLQVGADYRVLAANRAAVRQYGAAAGLCYELSHGYDSPCERNGEPCPKLAAESSRAPAAVLHVHRGTQGVERYKVSALPIAGGGILEFQIPIHDVALVDGLTGLTNRTEGEQLARRSVALMARMSLGYALIMLDLDHFKAVNDSYGHQVGDRVLKAFGKILHDTARETDIAVRWGGEEFLVVLLGEDADGAEHFAGRLLDQTRALEFEVEGALLRVTVSAGIRCVRPGEVGSVSFDQAVKDADDALYHTKRTGRNRLHLHCV